MTSFVPVLSTLPNGSVGALGKQPNLRLKLSGRGGRLVGKGFLLIAAAPARSLSAIR